MNEGNLTAKKYITSTSSGVSTNLEAFGCTVVSTFLLPPDLTDPPFCLPG